MNLKTGLGALAFAAAVALGGQAAATTVTSTFDTSTDGWTFGSYLGFSGIAVTYDAASQSINKTHGFGAFGFVAPLKYLGDKTELLGGALSFDLSSASTTYKNAPLVAITGNNGKTIFSRWGDVPGPQFHNFSIGLNAGAFYTGAPTDVAGSVSTASFAAIMADLEQIQIFADWNPGIDTAALDNVQMAGVVGVPEPATWAMMILGFGATGVLMRRRREAAFA